VISPDDVSPGCVLATGNAFRKFRARMADALLKTTLRHTRGVSKLAMEILG
jgi:hypothetical protein